MIREWAPLWAVPVIPLGMGESDATVEQRVRRVYPGHLERFVLKQLRRSGAAILIPRVLTQREEELPIPALTLNRWNAPRSALVYAPTSRGFDHYRLEAGRLREVWAASEPVAGAREIPQPPRPDRIMARAVLRRDRGGIDRLHLVTGTVLVLAVVARIGADQIPPTGEAIPSPSVLPATDPRQPRHPGPVPVASTADKLLLLAREIPGFRLTALEVTANRTVLRFTTDLSPGTTLDHMDRVWDRIVPELSATPSWNLAARRDGEYTCVTLEVGNE